MNQFSLFIYSLFLAIFLPTLLSGGYLLFFAPSIILSFYRYPLPICLWWAIICGFIIDLYSSQTRLGVYAINYCLVSLCLYRYKFHFFEDYLSTLPIMTFCFVILSTFFQLMFFYVIGNSIHISFDWIINNFIFTPFLNASYAILAFTIPSLIIPYINRNARLRKRN